MMYSRVLGVLLALGFAFAPATVVHRNTTERLRHLWAGEQESGVDSRYRAGTSCGVPCRCVCRNPSRWPCHIVRTSSSGTLFAKGLRVVLARSTVGRGFEPDSSHSNSKPSGGRRLWGI